MAVRGPPAPGQARPARPARETPTIPTGPGQPAIDRSTLQVGQPVAPVLAVIIAADPLASIGIAHVWLHEAMASTPLDFAAESVSLAVMKAGIIALAHRASQAARQGLRPPSREK